MTSMATTLPAVFSTMRSISWSPLRVRRCDVRSPVAVARALTHKVTKDSKSCPRIFPEPGAPLSSFAGVTSRRRAASAGSSS